MRAQETGAFSKNLAYLSEKNPVLVLQLQVEEKRSERKLSRPFKAKDPAFKEIEILYLFGWEGSSAVTSFLEWLEENPKRTLVFLSSDPARLAAALEDSLWTPLLKEKRVEWTLLDEKFHRCVWDFIYRPSCLCNLAPPGSLWEKEGEKLSEELKELEWEAEMTLSAHSDFGALPFNNLRRNILMTREVKEAAHLWGKFENMPALICGAGFSLNEQLAQLKSLEERALFIAAGSALSSLEKGGIEPHFGAALDPNLPPERAKRQKGFSVPIFYQHQLAPRLFSLLQGERLATLGSATSPWEGELLRRLGISSKPFEAGWNAVTFAVHIAYHLGCSPIILVGVDQCVRDEEVYAKGAAYPDEGERWKRVDAIPCIDREGRAARSRPDFLLGKKWIETFALKHPDCALINASKGGLPFKGIANTSLDDVADKDLSLQRDIRGYIHREIATLPMRKLEKKEVMMHIKEMEESIERSRALCDTLLASFSKQNCGEHLIAQIELEKEPFWQMVLSPAWDVWSHVLQRKEVIEAMEDVAIETKLQQLLLWQRVCLDYRTLKGEMS